MKTKIFKRTTMLLLSVLFVLSLSACGGKKAKGLSDDALYRDYPIMKDSDLDKIDSICKAQGLEMDMADEDFDRGTYFRGYHSSDKTTEFLVVYYKDTKEILMAELVEQEESHTLLKLLAPLMCPKANSDEVYNWAMKTVNETDVTEVIGGFDYRSEHDIGSSSEFYRFSAGTDRWLLWEEALENN